MDDKLEDKLKQNGFGDIILHENGEVEHRIVTLENLLPSLLGTIYITGKMVKAVTLKKLVKKIRWIPYQGVILWSEKGGRKEQEKYLELSIMMTKPKTSVRDAFNLYKGFEEIARLKDISQLKTNTLVPYEIMTKLGWETSSENPVGMTYYTKTLD